MASHGGMSTRLKKPQPSKPAHQAKPTAAAGNNRRTSRVFSAATARLFGQRDQPPQRLRPARRGEFPQHHREENGAEDAKPDGWLVAEEKCGKFRHQAARSVSTARIQGKSCRVVPASARVDDGELFAAPDLDARCRRLDDFRGRLDQTIPGAENHDSVCRDLVGPALLTVPRLGRWSRPRRARTGRSAARRSSGNASAAPPVSGDA